MVTRNQKGFFHTLVLIVFFVVLTSVAFVGWRVFNNKNGSGAKDSNGNTVVYDTSVSKFLSAGRCNGVGSVDIGPPMKIDQVSFVLPYGEVVGGHVTPIDHQYYNGLNPQALRDTYDVIAPADGTIVNVEHRGNKINTPSQTVDVPSSDEYRIVIAYSCSFYSYVDLVTSLDANIKSKVPALSGSGSVDVTIPVTKGEVIGHIGGQTLDFAVWDLSKQLPGFVNVSDYAGESWKPYTADPTDYMDAATKAAVVAKYVRTAAPVDGKIDYDIDGKLIGNWFQVGSGGYHASSNTAQDYWVGHLSIAPDNIDPSVYMASIGNYYLYPKPAVSTISVNGYVSPANSTDAAQFMIESANPDPATVGVGTGLVKYQLVSRNYVLANGQQWNAGSYATGIKAVSNGTVSATILAQLTDKRTLKFEVFPGKTSDQVTAFDSHAITYTR